MPKSVLIIDDEQTLADRIRVYLSRHGFEIQTAESGETGLIALESFRPDVVLLDYQMNGMDGLEVLQTIYDRDPTIKVIMMTGHGSLQLAVDAMKAHAYDYLSKPLVLAELKLLLDKAIGQERLEGVLAYYQNRQAKRGGLDRLLGASPSIQSLKRKIAHFIDAERQMAEDGAPPTVLITGETGTGKELVARAFHFEGRRRAKPFLEVNCASIPANLMEAELFGYERGAFTDAKERKIGLVEAAHGGTLFLDEIGEMEPVLQAKCLRLIEDKRIRRLGGLRDHEVDVRIIAATNQNLAELVKQGQFRADLYYRLRIIGIELPPLRERDGDVVLLAKEFLHIMGRRYGKPELSLTPLAAAVLRRHHWPGNVRELRNVIEQAVLLADGAELHPNHLAVTSAPADQALLLPLAQDVFLHHEADLNLERLEQRAICEALQRTDGNVTQAARLLGLTRDTLRYRMEKYQLRNEASTC